ncbi:hypothetical protein [Streptomyces sp. NPDC053427]|uniref:hypothetical protein n=1 Tax=Streptomyces sp. NPDC053427 TaxID=3365701 RepID=UPI0037D3C7AE
MATRTHLLNRFTGTQTELEQASFVLEQLERLATAKRNNYEHLLLQLPSRPLPPVYVEADPVTVRADTFFDVNTISDDTLRQTIAESFPRQPADFTAHLQTVARSCLDQVLGIPAEGEAQRSDGFVAIFGQDIVRVDVWAWRYAFEPGKLTAGAGSVFCYAVALSHVKTNLLTDAAVDDLVWQRVNQIKGLDAEQRRHERDKLHAAIMAKKDGTAQKRARLEKLTRAVNDRLGNRSDDIALSTVGSDGVLYIASSIERQVFRAAPGLGITAVAGRGTSPPDQVDALQAQLKDPVAVAADDAHRGFVLADVEWSRVCRVTGGTIYTIADGTKIPGGSKDHPIRPTVVSADVDGTVYAMAYQVLPERGALLRIVRIAVNGTVTVWKEEDLKNMLPPSPFDSAGVAARGAGRAVFTLTPCGTVEELSGDAPRVTLLGGGGTDESDSVPDARRARLVNPRGTDLGHDGDVYVADCSNLDPPGASRIRKITSAGRMETVARNSGLTSLAVNESDGVVYALQWGQLYAYLLPSWH